MNKTELIDAVAGKADVSKAAVAKTVDSLIETITDTVRSGEKVSVTGFGTFEVRDRAARIGRNPRTGAEVQVPASKAPAFKAGKSFKDAVNNR
ncbi:MAG TPA: HU family DNA-binding protein [Egibacteraceae bacterium]|nr:HU family DNA-binding protein [Egibacteraceae bacterium]